MSHDDKHGGREEEGRIARSRRDVGTATTDADEPAQARNVGDGDRNERRKAGQSGSSVLADAAAEVSAVDDILEGEVDEAEVAAIIRSEQWTGPLPPPAALAAYEHILPGAADRVLTMAEREVGLRESRELTVRAAVDGEVEVQVTVARADRDALRRGQYIAGAISLVVAGLSFGGMFLTPWAVVGFAVPLAQIASTVVRTVSDGIVRRSGYGRPDGENSEDDE